MLGILGMLVSYVYIYIYIHIPRSPLLLTKSSVTQDGWILAEFFL